MSIVKIQGHASGTGTLTVTAPNTSTNRTLTLPDTTGTLLDENSSLPAANLTGTVADARISALTSSKLTGNLPALNASSLTNIPAANITGTLPAISGASLTGIETGRKGRNIITNGAMQVSQRNGTTDTTVGSSEVYTLDRWKTFNSQASKISVQQSTIVPTGFKNSAKITVQSAVSIGSSDYFGLCTDIEGQDVAHLSFGSASAEQITLSFWVRSSLTGTFGAAIREQSNSPSRSYATNYTISSADTWEKKTITIAGDQSGTWSKDNTAGLGLWFDLGTGSTYQGTLNTWEGANDATTSGTVSVVGTGSATWYVTGVQLEVGSVATDFEFRSHSEELALCQRYYHEIQTGFVCTGATGFVFNIQFPVTMRATPSQSHSYVGVANDVYKLSDAATPTFVPNGIFMDVNGLKHGYDFDGGFTAGEGYVSDWIFDSEL